MTLLRLPRDLALGTRGPFIKAARFWLPALTLKAETASDEAGGSLCPPGSPFSCPSLPALLRGFPPAAPFPLGKPPWGWDFPRCDRAAGSLHPACAALQAAAFLHGWHSVARLLRCSTGCERQPRAAAGEPSPLQSMNPGVCFSGKSILTLRRRLHASALKLTKAEQSPRFVPMPVVLQ